MFVDRINEQELINDGLIEFGMDRHNEFEYMRVGDIEDLDTLTINEFLDLF